MQPSDPPPSTTPSDWSIDPDIRRAETPPAEVYHAPSWYRLALDRVFARGWHYLADANDVPEPSTAHPLIWLPDSLDEPVVVVRDAKGVVRCLSNVCTHRGNLVITETGPIRRLRCGYHGRRFELDGRFRSMPEFDDVENFPCTRDDLASLPLASWGPLLIASLDPAAEFDAWWKPVEALIGSPPPRAHRFAPERSRDYVVEANWALYVENYLEGFHIPFVHESLNEVIDFSTYRSLPLEWGVLQWSEGSDAEATFRPGETRWPEFARANRIEGDPDRLAALYLWLFPGLMLNFYPWGLSLNTVEPLGPTRTRVRFRAYVADETRLGRGAGGDLDRVELEDEAIVEQVQQGVRSRIYSRGRYSPTQEIGTHHFHRLLVRALAR